MAVVWGLLLIVRSARAWTVVWVVFESLLVVSPELTEALLSRMVPSAMGAPTLTWIVNTVVPPTALFPFSALFRSWRAAVHSLLEPVVWKVVPVGSVSEALRLPVWDEGPLLVTRSEERRVGLAPGIAVAGALLTIGRSARAWTGVWVVFEALLGGAP